MAVATSSSAGTAPSAKGSNFIGLLRALDELRGPEAVQRCIAAVPAELRGLEHGQIVSVGWYPVDWYVPLHAVVDRMLGGGPDLARELGRTATLRDFTTLHRLLVALLSPETVVAQAPRLMALYFRGGTAERVEVRRGYARVRLAGWKGFSRLLWEDIIGGMEGVLMVCKAAHPKANALVPLEATEAVEVELFWG